MLLSIETSCDETACAVFDTQNFLQGAFAKEAIVHSELYTQVAFHQEYGGVVPEIAAREHIRTLPVLLERCLDSKKLKINDLTSVSVTAGPGLKGCLLVGVSLAKGLSASLGIPIYPINHLEAHLLSGFSDCTADSINEKFPALVLLVSGGNSLLVLVRDVGEYEVLCATQDDAAGEAFDKIGSMLGLGYPAGKKVSELAKRGRPVIPLPKAVKGIPEQFSFSGLKTAANLRLKAKAGDFVDEVEKEQYICDFSASLEEAIVGSLVDKTNYWMDALKKNALEIKRLVVCGGVAANESLRRSFCDLAESKKVEIFIPPFELCTDNAEMIAIATGFRIKKYCSDGKILKDLSFPVRARWPITEIEGW